MVGIRAHQREAFHLRPLGLDRLAAGLGQLPLRAALAGHQANGKQQYGSPSGHGRSRHEVAFAHVRSISRVRAEYRATPRSEEHTSELQSLMRTSYAGVCLKTTTQTATP